VFGFPFAVVNPKHEAVAVTVLRLGDAGDQVKSLQRGLNKLGEMLLVDGRFGPATRESVAAARWALAMPGPAQADSGLTGRLAELPDPFPRAPSPAPRSSRAKRSSARRTTGAIVRRPPGRSQATGSRSGIGYSLLCARTSDVFTGDWGGRLPPATVDRLLPLVGKVGSPRLLESVNDVVVPFDVALRVFVTRSLPRSFTATRNAYPQVDALMPARRTALLSLVHTRGGPLSQTLDHLEMRTIRALLASGYEDSVASPFDAMTRRWDPFTRPGPVRRRQAEATLWRSGFPALQLD
jgi:hypothetical protein